MQNKALVADMPSINETSNVCGVCQIGKLSQSPFPKNQAWRTTERLKLIHTDVCEHRSTLS